MNQNFKTPELLIAAEKLEGELRRYSMELKQVYDAKNIAISAQRLEDAARHREKEVELANRLETLMGK